MVIELEKKIFTALRASPGKEHTLEEIAAAAGAEDPESVFWILRHLAANPDRGVVRTIAPGKGVFDATYRLG